MSRRNAVSSYCISGNVLENGSSDFDSVNELILKRSLTLSFVLSVSLLDPAADSFIYPRYLSLKHSK